MRRRILFAIGGTLLVMLLIISASSSAILRDAYTNLEHRYIVRDIQRVLGDLARRPEALSRVAEDYAAWTPMYEFVRHPAGTFVQDTFTEEGAENLRLGIVVARDAAGHTVFRRDFGLAPSQAGMTDSLLEWLNAHPQFARFPDKDGQAAGLLNLRQGLLVVAARPILDDRRSLPPDGTLIMARVLDSRTIREIGQQLLTTVAVYPLDASLPDSAQKALAKLDPATRMYVDASGPTVVSSYSVVTGLDGSSMALVQVDSPRDIRDLGARTVGFFFIWLFFVGAGFGGVVLLTIERTVLSRLVHLGQSLLAIGTGGDASRRIEISGRDQIAYIGAAINGMLDAQARATEELRASERRNEAFLDAVPDVIFRVTRDGTILDARSPRRLPLLEAVDDLVGKDEEMILPLYSFLSPELFDRSIAATAAALDSGAAQRLVFHVDTDAGRRWYEERFVASSESEAIVLVREVTDQRVAEEARRKEILLKEIHHRVKNNLQVISSLLALQAGATSERHTRDLLNESRNRVHSMALIHEKLYQSVDERGISFAAYVKDLAAHLRHSYAGNSDAVKMAIDVEDITLDMDSLVPCGLIINELLSNALKYAFPDGRTGTITVHMRRRPEKSFVLTVTDDGVGLPSGVELGTARTLGLRIVESLVAQLRGTLTTGRGPGASFTIEFPGK
ncbi:MAG TPA: histidine kinase dimerization/phosphoacceptor domain -containing protein [Spirochaetia bacterium]|nr:histidine kinase dimerization/phosphoacceptor domain -containing protein [Spirochaetia bacterium]